MARVIKRLLIYQMKQQTINLAALGVAPDRQALCFAGTL